MKQKIINSIVITIIIIVMAALIIPWPRPFVKEFIGIKYQLGPDNKNYAEKVNISFNGIYKKSYFGLIKDIYTGYIYIDGVDIHDHDFTISFKEERYTIISHRYFDKNQVAMIINKYGKLYLDEELEELSIELYEGEYGSEGFDTKNGFVISAPAINREEAIDISSRFNPHSD